MKKFLTVTLAIIMLSIPFSNVALAAQSVAETTSESVQISNSLETILEKDNVSKGDLKKYSQYAKKELSKDNTIYWKLAAAKKAIKFAVDHSNLIPSKTIKNWVKKYGGKMVEAIDSLEGASRTAIRAAFVEVGIPRDVADAIADFIVKWIL